MNFLILLLVLLTTRKKKIQSDVKCGDQLFINMKAGRFDNF